MSTEKKLLLCRGIEDRGLSRSTVYLVRYDEMPLGNVVARPKIIRAFANDCCRFLFACVQGKSSPDPANRKGRENGRHWVRFARHGAFFKLSRAFCRENKSLERIDIQRLKVLWKR